MAAHHSVDDRIKNENLQQRYQQLCVYLEDEIFRIGEMLNRVTRELVTRADYFTPEWKRYRCDEDLDVIRRLGKDVCEIRSKLERLYMHTHLIHTDDQRQGHDETDRWSEA